MMQGQKNIFIWLQGTAQGQRNDRKHHHLHLQWLCPHLMPEDVSCLLLKVQEHLSNLLPAFAFPFPWLRGCSQNSKERKCIFSEPWRQDEGRLQNLKLHTSFINTLFVLWTTIFPVNYYFNVSLNYPFYTGAFHLAEESKCGAFSSPDIQKR